jgi:hypothetical protein
MSQVPLGLEPTAGAHATRQSVATQKRPRLLRSAARPSRTALSAYSSQGNGSVGTGWRRLIPRLWEGAQDTVGLCAEPFPAAPPGVGDIEGTSPDARLIIATIAFANSDSKNRRPSLPTQTSVVAV